MKNKALQQLFADITVWKRGDQRAPHKPLLLLIALAKCSRGESREIPYAEIDQPLRELLIEFGPERKAYHPELPFWHLQSDGIWELDHLEDLTPRKGSSNAPKSELLKHNVSGGFPKDIFDALRKDPQLLAQVAQSILEQHFPATFHDDILQAVGLDLNATSQVTRKKRDPEFRIRVLTAYEYRCAICGFDVRLGNHGVGLEAAHIRWHQADGPDVERNGLALCVLHHKLFDRGAMTISPAHLLLVSEKAHGASGFAEWLLAFHGKSVNKPVNSEYLPAEQFVNWHAKEVFHGPARKQ